MVAVVKGVLKVITLDGHVAIVPFDLVCAPYKALGDEIDDLTDIQDDAEGRSSNHEICEDLLLSGVANVAVHYVGARRHCALDQPWQVEAIVDSVEDVEEGDLNARLDKETDQIGPPQAAVFLPRVVVQLVVLAKLGPVLALTVLTIRHVHDHHE